MDAKVTFVVPCYNLAHFLSECVDSILSQTYGDFEILIMDDCSPDNTPEVALSFTDPRVKHVRNEVNLGHLANYNKGIGMARGEYVWLISADDRLRSSDILERYVTVMDRHPEVGYAFCPAMDLADGRETGLAAYSVHGERDTIFEGRKFLDKLLDGNTVVAASGMARKECYDRLGMFPPNMPYAGDWYLWCLFALYYDVAYFSEPMVSYRSHGQTMTKILMKRNYDIFRDGIAVLTNIRRKARDRGEDALALKCGDRLDRMIERYVHQLALDDEDFVSSTSTAFEKSLDDCSPDERKRHAARFLAELGERYYDSGEIARARGCYRKALERNPRLPKVWIKYFLLCLGKPGLQLRAFLSGIRRRQA